MTSEKMTLEMPSPSSNFSKKILPYGKKKRKEETRILKISEKTSEDSFIVRK
jgi:hypothetical protein